MNQQIKINKRGRVFSKTQFGKETLFNSALPVFITPSLKEVLKTFGESIVLLEATGTKEIQNNPLELEHLGVFISTRMENKCIIKYDRSYTKLNKNDDLTPMNINRIISSIEKNKILDCAVTKLKVKIKDEKLREIISELYPQSKPLSDEFYIEFKSTYCEGDEDTELWEGTPCNNELLKLKFKKTLLHCVKLIDDGQIFTIQRAKRFYYINWDPTQRELDRGEFKHKSPEEVAHALIGSFGEYGYVKKYKMGKENKLVLLSIK